MARVGNHDDCHAISQQRFEDAGEAAGSYGILLGLKVQNGAVPAAK
jgi:hypothetical protein